jgi:hypothetical protein
MSSPIIFLRHLYLFSDPYRLLPSYTNDTKEAKCPKNSEKINLSNIDFETLSQMARKSEDSTPLPRHHLATFSGTSLDYVKKEGPSYIEHNAVLKDAYAELRFSVPFFLFEVSPIMNNKN